MPLLKMSGGNIRSPENIEESYYLIEELKMWLFKTGEDFIEEVPPTEEGEKPKIIPSESTQETLYRFASETYAGSDCVAALIHCRKDLPVLIENTLTDFCKGEFKVKEKKDKLKSAKTFMKGLKSGIMESRISRNINSHLSINESFQNIKNKIAG